MKKINFSLLIIFALVATPVWATWQPTTPTDYSPITWAKAPGIASFFKAPQDGVAIDFLTRVYLPQNEIKFIVATTTPTTLPKDETATASTDLKAFPNLNFERFSAEEAKTLSPKIKFLWDAPFFNMKSPASDLSMAVKYSTNNSSTISSGSRSIPDMTESRRMLVIDNKTGKAVIKDFEPTFFADEKNGDQAIEGFGPTVGKSDSGSTAAARLFLGVSDDGQELVIYCSRLATIKDASEALITAGISMDHQLQADGGGSTACGYNLPGQYFVEPIRTLPLMMGAETITRGTITTKIINVRSGPSLKDSVVTQLNLGDVVRIYSEKNGWYRIGEGQWAFKPLIKQLF